MACPLTGKTLLEDARLTASPPSSAGVAAAGERGVTGQSGLGLPELMLALLLSTMVLGLALPALLEFTRLHQLRAASRDWARVLTAARQWAFVQQQGARLEMSNAGGPCLVLHTGGRGECRGCAAHLSCTPGARLLDTTAPLHPTIVADASSTSMVWSPQERTVSPAGTFRLESPDGRAIHLVVNLVGRLRLCSPDRLVGGLPPC